MVGVAGVSWPVTLWACVSMRSKTETWCSVPLGCIPRWVGWTNSAVMVKRIRRFASEVAMRGDERDLQQCLGAHPAKLSIHFGKRQDFH